jgi:hypothetical protein
MVTSVYSRDDEVWEMALADAKRFRPKWLLPARFAVDRERSTSMLLFQNSVSSRAFQANHSQPGKLDKAAGCAIVREKVTFPRTP